MNRRQLVSGVCAIVVPPASVIGTAGETLAQGVPPRQSLAQFSQDAAKVTALKRGVALMKSRRPSDPRSWFYQAAIHGVSDDFVRDASAGDAGMARVDRKFWNQCTHFGNSTSADFLIWHRAYLHYFERILREASGDPTLSLPYWNYGDPAQRACPRIFADPDPDPGTRRPRNPLYDARRDPAFRSSSFNLSDAAVSVSLAAQRTAFFSTVAGNAFGGATTDESTAGKGRAESQPHDQIHMAIGGLMAEVDTAAFDPLFWVHHANVDRLWNVWDCLPYRVWGVRPRTAWLDARPWWFVDADGSTKNMPRSAYLSAGALGVRFDSDPGDCVPLSSTVPSAQRPADEAVLLAQMSEPRVVAVGQSMTLSATGRQTATVSIREGSGQNSKQLLSVPAPGRRVLLKINGVNYDAPPSVGFAVFVNLPEGERADPTSSHYVGNLTLFGVKHAGHGGADRQGQLFDMTGIARQPGFNPESIRVDLAPFDLLQSSGGAPAERRSGNARVGSFQVLVIDGVPEDGR